MSQRRGDRVAAGRNGSGALAARLTEDGACRRTLEVTVPRSRVERRRAAVALEYASTVRLKGFRRGRVPRSVIDRRFGAAIEKEAVDRSVRSACAEAIDSEDLRPISDVDIVDVEFPANGPLTFSAQFEVRPVIKLDRIGGFRLTRSRIEAAEGAVARVVERLRRERATWHPETEGKAAPGDQVEVSVTPLDGAPNGETETRHYELMLGDGSALPEMEEAIATLGVGEEGDFEVAFPDDFADSGRRGTVQRMRIELLSRRTPELPAADDSFARSLGAVDGIDDLRGRIAHDLEVEARIRAERELDNELLAMVIDANPFDAPESMVDTYTDALIGGMADIDGDEADSLRESLRPTAEYAVKRDLMLHRIADEHGLHPAEADIDREIESLAERTDEDPRRVRARLAESERIADLARRLMQRRVFALLRSSSEVSEAS